jgi:hypothetical protein
MEASHCRFEDNQTPDKHEQLNDYHFLYHILKALFLLIFLCSPKIPWISASAVGGPISISTTSSSFPIPKEIEKVSHIQEHKHQ